MQSRGATLGRDPARCPLRWRPSSSSLHSIPNDPAQLTSPANYVVVSREATRRQSRGGAVWTALRRSQPRMCRARPRSADRDAARRKMRPPFLGPVREQCFGFPSLPGIRMLRPSLSLAFLACSSGLNDVRGPGSAHLSPSAESLTKLGRTFACCAEGAARGFGATERSALIGSRRDGARSRSHASAFVSCFFSFSRCCAQNSWPRLASSWERTVAQKDMLCHVGNA